MFSKEEKKEDPSGGSASFNGLLIEIALAQGSKPAKEFCS
jgi:hypothetical protein